MLVDIDDGSPSYEFGAYVLESGASIRVYTDEIHPSGEDLASTEAPPLGPTPPPSRTLLAYSTSPAFSSLRRAIHPSASLTLLGPFKVRPAGQNVMLERTVCHSGAKSEASLPGSALRLFTSLKSDNQKALASPVARWRPPCLSAILLCDAMATARFLIRAGTGAK